MAQSKPWRGNDAVLEIPGEATFWKTYDIAPLSVLLPIDARARVGWAVWCLLAPLSLLMVFATCAVLWSLLHESHESHRVAQFIRDLGLFLLVAPIAIGFAGMFTTALLDRFWVGHCLCIMPDGLVDRRASSQVFKFSDIVRAEMMVSRGGVAAIRLHFRSPVTVQHNPFRMGTLTFRLRSGKHDLHVPLLGLDQDPRTLAFAILKLAKAHGASVEIATPYCDPVLQNDVARL